ncbi:hypothetical protein AGOR_G00208530 [Albula goreensis]|uniref:Uncharacterized protein n=1 Tax=Albula goreensis TaxID=1534307 RepID=A0A8T3CPG9_9TELE|nr:hypothetical protein AGOR_G00208530 [Albula goreensis]
MCTPVVSQNRERVLMYGRACCVAVCKSCLNKGSPQKDSYSWVALIIRRSREALNSLVTRSPRIFLTPRSAV